MRGNASQFIVVLICCETTYILAGCLNCDIFCSAFLVL
jgi:hypothetical protein